MNLKVITLNTWFNKFLDKQVDFIKKEDPDVLLLQEVTSGLDSKNDSGPTNGYQQLIQSLPGYFYAYTPMWHLSLANNTYDLGLAIFSKAPLLETHSIYYYKEMQFISKFTGGQDFPGVYLSGKISVAGQIIEIISTHFIWSLFPEINHFQKEAIPIFKKHLAGKQNFILGGDFNVTDDSEIYQELVSIVKDDRPKGTKRTLHPQLHKVGTAKELAVDYLFHKGSAIQLLSSQVPVVPLSDHLPIVATYNIQENL